MSISSQLCQRPVIAGETSHPSTYFTNLDRGTCRQLLRRYGTFSLAYSTFAQKGLRHFGNATGYLAFAEKWGCKFVLGDPVAADRDWRPLLLAFAKAYPKSVFCQISASAAKVLEAAGYYINEMGVDTHLDLETYNFDGKSKEWLRYAANWVARRDYRVIEGTFDDFSPPAVHQVSEAWKSTRTIKSREVQFLNRPLVLEDEPDTRKFFLLDADSRLVAYVFFDPLYHDGQVIGYCTCIKRRLPTAPSYGEQAIMKHAIEVFQYEDKQLLTLGLSPLAEIKNKTFRRNALLHFSFRQGFQAKWVNRFFYPLRGHAEYKRRFRGIESQTHYASNVIFNDLRIVALLRLSGVL